MGKKDIMTRLYVAAVALTGVALLVFALPALPIEDWPSIALLAVLCALAQRAPVPLFASSSMSMSVAFAFAGLLLFGPAAAVLINMPSILVHAVYPKQRPPHKTIFNLGLWSTAAAVSGIMYMAAGGIVPVENYLASMLPMGLAALCYFFVQTGGVSLAIVLSEGGSFTKVWDSNYRWLVLNYLAIAGISLGMALVYRSIGPAGVLSFCLPLAMGWYSLRLYMAHSRGVRAENESLQSMNGRLEEGIRSILHALATEADTKSSNGTHHPAPADAVRYATETAQRLGLDAPTIAAVQVGALCHDIGKISIPDSILQKPADLTQEEWDIVRQHPVRGAKVIQQVTALRDVVPAIRHHHERFDGQGYPDRLRGSEIPLSAQILAVVEAFLAMTSDRPYRRALSSEQALSELRRNAGAQFNADVVQAFVAAHEAIPSSESRSPEVDLTLFLHPRPAVRVGV